MTELPTSARPRPVSIPQGIAEGIPIGKTANDGRAEKGKVRVGRARLRCDGWSQIEALLVIPTNHGRAGSGKTGSDTTA